MKKLLLLFMAVIVMANVSAQEESGLYKSENLYYVLNDADKTATLSSWKRLHDGAYVTRKHHDPQGLRRLDNGALSGAQRHFYRHEIYRGKGRQERRCPLAA